MNFFFTIGEYLAKLQASTWLFRALSPSFSSSLAKHTEEKVVLCTGGRVPHVVRKWSNLLHEASASNDCFVLIELSQLFSDQTKMSLLSLINTKNCSLSIVLTATDQKPQKSLKRWYYPPSHCVMPVGSRGRAPGQGVRGAKPPPREAENLLASGCATEAANLPHSLLSRPL